MACVAILGDLNWDLVFHVPYLPQFGGEVLVRRAFFRLGGSATNTSRWLRQLGFDIHLFAAVSNDPLGELACRKLEEEGVSSHFLQTVPAPAGICCAFVDEKGERTLVTHRGANALLGPDLPRGFLDGADWLHLSGYALLEESSRTAFFLALDEARQRKIPVSVDPGMVSVHQHGHILKEVSPVDVFLPNWEEAQALLGKKPARELLSGLSSFANRVFLKLGAEGCLAKEGARVAHVPALATEVKDSVGAGDAFNAGVIAAALWGGGLLAQSILGTLLGTLAVAALPPQLPQVLKLLAKVPLPEREEVRAIILEHWPTYVD